MQEPSVLTDVATRLEREGIPYFLTGSVALSCYVSGRTTIDIDIVVQISRSDVSRLMTAFETDYYLDRGAMEEAIRFRRSFNLIHYERLIKVDFIVPASSELVEARFARRRRLPVDGLPIWVLAPEDLILAKLEWARAGSSERQIEDVRRLLSDVSELDVEYLASGAERLGLRDLLERAQP